MSYYPGYGYYTTAQPQQVGPQPPSNVVNRSTSVRMCMSCGAGIELGARVCPHCGWSVSVPRQRASLVVTGGALVLLGAIIALAIGAGYLLIATTTEYNSATNDYSTKVNYYSVFAGASATWAFSMAMSAYVFCSRQEHYRIAIWGSLALVVTGIISLLGCAFDIISVVGVVPLIFGTMGSLFIYSARPDFEKTARRAEMVEREAEEAEKRAGKENTISNDRKT